MSLHRPPSRDAASPPVPVRPSFALGPDAEPPQIPRHELPDNELDPRTAYQIVHDELMLDGNARLNLATFVTTWMEPEAAELMAECFDKNMIDKDEYPQTAELESRCVSILANLWHAPAPEDAVGCSTTGSSEACMLAGMALLHRWRAKDTGTGKPNLVMGANVQICWEKFCRYWDVEPRLQDVSADDTGLNAERAVAACDENTIGVVAILGSTFDGIYEPVADIVDALDKLAKDGPDVPVHVDAASGGFIAPFLDPHLEWDFRLERVHSINASGHKYGLVYPGVGWVVWRDEAALPEELVFHVDYLGGDMPTFALNFSRPGAQVAAQYYMLLRLGRDGYTRIQQQSRDIAQWLSRELDGRDAFTAISDGSGIPAFAFRMADGVDGYNVFDVSETVRASGWIVPAYKMPAGYGEAVLRIVVRAGFTRDLGELLLRDIDRTVERLEKTGGIPPDAQRVSFHH